MSEHRSPATCEHPKAIYVWIVPSETVLDQPGSWRIRKWDTEPFPEATHVATIKCPLNEASATNGQHAVPFDKWMDGFFVGWREECTQDRIKEFRAVWDAGAQFAKNIYSKIAQAEAAERMRWQAKALPSETAAHSDFEKLRAEEIEEFNAGVEAFRAGTAYADLPDMPHDQNGVGWAWGWFLENRPDLAAVSSAVRETIPHDAEWLLNELIRRANENAELYSGGLAETQWALIASWLSEHRVLLPAIPSATATPIPEEFTQIAKFYAAASLAALVRAQAKHIESLQAKLPPRPPFPGVQRVREG